MSSEALREAFVWLEAIASADPKLVRPSGLAAALLAEVARLEQERDEARAQFADLLIGKERPPEAVFDQFREIYGLPTYADIEAALAVAREREQRAVDALREAEFSQCGWAGGCPVCAETPDEWAPNRGHHPNCKLGAALVDEPAAATLAEPEWTRHWLSPRGSASAAADEPGETPCP